MKTLNTQPLPNLVPWQTYESTDEHGTNTYYSCNGNGIRDWGFMPAPGSWMMPDFGLALCKGCVRCTKGKRHRRRGRGGHHG